MDLVEINKAARPRGYATYRDAAGRKQRQRMEYLDPSDSGRAYRQPKEARGKAARAAGTAGRVAGRVLAGLPPATKVALYAGVGSAAVKGVASTVRRVRVHRAKRMLKRKDASLKQRVKAFRLVMDDKARREMKKRGPVVKALPGSVSKATLWRGTSAAGAKQARKTGTLAGVPGSAFGDIGRGIYTTPSRTAAMDYANPLPNGDRSGRSGAASGTGKRKRTGYVLRLETGKQRPLWEGNMAPRWARRAAKRFEAAGEGRNLDRDGRPGRGGTVSLYQQVTLDPAKADRVRVTRIDPVNRTSAQRVDDRALAAWGGDGQPYLGRYRMMRDAQAAEPARRRAMAADDRREVLRRRRAAREAAQRSGLPWEGRRAVQARLLGERGSLHRELG